MNVTVARIASASRLISVCEKTVPASTGSSRRAEPSRRRLRTSTRVGSPMRPGKTAEPITPIIVARITGAHGIAMRGSAARSTSCQEIARKQQRERHQRERERDPAGGGGGERVADAVQAELREREAQDRGEQERGDDDPRASLQTPPGCSREALATPSHSRCIRARGRCRRGPYGRGGAHRRSRGAPMSWRGPTRAVVCRNAGAVCGNARGLSAGTRGLSVGTRGGCLPERGGCLWEREGAVCRNAGAVCGNARGLSAGTRGLSVGTRGGCLPERGGCLWEREGAVCRNAGAVCGSARSCLPEGPRRARVHTGVRARRARKTEHLFPFV